MMEVNFNNFINLVVVLMFIFVVNFTNSVKLLVMLVFISLTTMGVVNSSSSVNLVVMLLFLFILFINLVVMVMFIYVVGPQEALELGAAEPVVEEPQPVEESPGEQVNQEPQVGPQEALELGVVEPWMENPVPDSGVEPRPGTENQGGPRDQEPEIPDVEPVPELQVVGAVVQVETRAVQKRRRGRTFSLVTTPISSKPRSALPTVVDRIRSRLGSIRSMGLGRSSVGMEITGGFSGLLCHNNLGRRSDPDETLRDLTVTEETLAEEKNSKIEDTHENVEELKIEDTREIVDKKIEDRPEHNLKIEVNEKIEDPQKIIGVNNGVRMLGLKQAHHVSQMGSTIKKKYKRKSVSANRSSVNKQTDIRKYYSFKNREGQKSDTGVRGKVGQGVSVDTYNDLGNPDES